ncbi:MAG: hypothetical protein IPM54_24300, partial [Polyangiaceae bacterium]|nr:hypothetical protein [Polyangiaceae bacterium]
MKLDVPGVVQSVTGACLGKIRVPPPPGKTAQRVAAGIVVGSVGLGALGTAVGLAVAARRTNEESKQYYLPDDRTSASTR